MVRTIAIVQARMGSTRLPGKVLMDLAGRPVLEWVMHRLGRAKSLSELVVATSTLPDDDSIEELCRARRWNVFRGSESDVLDRYYKASKAFGGEVVVRVTSDCPLIDPVVVDRVVEALSTHPPVDYVSNVLESRTFPRGLDVEAFTAEALADAWHSDQSTWREHVTPYLYRNPDRFRLRPVLNSQDFSGYRWTVDTQDDLAAIRALVAYVPDSDAGWKEYITVMQRYPHLAKINRTIMQKSLD